MVPLAAVTLLSWGLVRGELVLNEISHKALGGQRSDWIEIYNSGTSAVDLTPYRIEDDKSPKVWMSNDTLAAGAHLVLIADDAKQGGLPFKLGGCDNLTLWNGKTQVDTYTWCLGPNDPEDVTYCRFPDGTGALQSGCQPTPGVANVEPASQSSLDLFASDEVFKIKITLTPENEAYLWANSSYELYVQANMTYELPELDNTPTAMKGPVRIRPRGFSTLAIPECMAMKKLPFALDFDKHQKGQTFFGVRKAFLRNNMMDWSQGLRDWAANKYLEKFGLPFLRVRFFELFINGESLGLYLFMETPDEEKVLMRNFPKFNKDTAQLYKVKPNAGGLVCGETIVEMDPDDAQTMSVLMGVDPSKVGQQATAYQNSTSVAKRGEHIEKTDQLGAKIDDPLSAFMACFGEFAKKRVVPLVMEAMGKMEKYPDCAEMIVAEDWLDRDYGSGPKTAAVEFIRLLNRPGGVSSEAFAEVVDVENWLRNMAALALYQAQDSPLHNGNNWYLVDPGHGKWGIFQYDHNNLGQLLECHNPMPGQTPTEDHCKAADLVDWSITRPTCGPVSKNLRLYPLLQDEAMMDRYIGYIEEFLPLYADTTFLEAQAKVVRPYAKSDPFANHFGDTSGGVFGLETSPMGSSNMAEGMGLTPPLIGFVKERARAVREQIDMIKSGKQAKMLPKEDDAKLKDCATGKSMLHSVLRETSSTAGSTTAPPATTQSAQVAGKDASSAFRRPVNGVALLLICIMSVFAISS